MRRIAPVTALLLMASLCAALAPRLAGAQPGDAASVWVPKDVQFIYTGFTTKYTCEGLMTRVRGILLALGARDDLQVVPFGCMRVSGPVTNSGVRISMHVLQPASAVGGQSVAAQWKTVDVLADRNPTDAALDCELIAQLMHEVLPLFSPRQIDYSAQCSVHSPLIGGTRLKVEVLVPEKAPPVATRQ